MPAVPATMSLHVGVAMTEADMPLPPLLRAPRQPDKLEGPLVRFYPQNQPCMSFGALYDCTL